MKVVYRTRLTYQLWRFHLLLIVFAWLFGISSPTAFMFNSWILYDAANQLRQLPLHVSISIISITHGVYVILVPLTVIIYIVLVSYVNRMSQRVQCNNRLTRIKQDLKMVQRIIILVSILLICCLLYGMSMFQSFFTTIGKYHARISYVFIDSSHLVAIIAPYPFTDQLQESLKKLCLERRNRVLPAKTRVTTIVK